MPRRSLLAFLVLLSGCSAQQEVEQPDGIWQKGNSLGVFTDSWSVCRHFRATTSDLKWLIDVDVSRDRGAFDASELVSLVDLRHVADRECAVSLYRLSDIACAGEEPIIIPASQGDGILRHTLANPDWESTFDLDIRDLTFRVDDQEVGIDRVRFSDVQYSSFCPG